MTRVYLTEQGSVGRKQGGQLLVEKDGEPLLRVPLAQVEQVVVVGRGIQLSTALMVELLGRGVEIAFLSRTGRYYGKASGAPNGNAAARAAQHAFLVDPARAVPFVRSLVTQKLAAQREHLRERGADPTLAERVARQQEAARTARTIDQLRGHEGAAAATYWQALAPLTPPAWGFTNRRHHPPPDPLNALLSFGYTLLLQELVGAVNVAGLDPYFGALHLLDPGRPSLALDLEEPLRPLGVDRWVFSAVLDGTLGLQHFHRDGERVLLTPDGRRRFLALYERQMRRRVQHLLAPGRIEVRQAVLLHVRLTNQVFDGRRAGLEPLRWP